jgi:CHAT domain-containing protein
MFTGALARQRPGVAQTQAVLARQFSEGNDEASALFRLSVSRSREIARAEQEIASLRAKPSPTQEDRTALAAAISNVAALREQQTGLQSQLAVYPRYLALARSALELPELQSKLRPGEAYWQLIDSSAGVFALLATPGSARIYRTGLTSDELQSDVKAIRDSIAKVDQGQVVTDPFDAERSFALFTKLMGPITADLPGIRHLVVEPDGALLQLPVSVLVTERAGIDAYKARLKSAGADEFDFRGISWLGRGREISTAVGPRSFLDVRAVPSSHARKIYLGLGGNAVPKARPVAAVTDSCEWPLAAWQAPIATDELKRAEQLFGGNRSELITGAAFSDTNLLADRQLSDFRVVHFATHGLVTAPRPDCPPRPALLTSFGDGPSDGLLTFKEIFDLKLDADVVILSACDTAGLATVSASREAGVSSGGNYALDGLVRAFVGAGARSVVASHWPVPDDFGATRRLMGGLLGGAPGVPLATSLAAAQGALMNDAKTSHPFYWAAFIILGDGAKPLLPANLASGVSARSAAK